MDMESLGNVTIASELIFRKSLRELFHEISFFGTEGLLAKRRLREDEIEQRVRFFRKMKGCFLRLCRQRLELSLDSLGIAVGLSAEQISSIESGARPISDLQFADLCCQLNAGQHVEVFLEKVEEALRPGLDLATPLKAHGIRLAYPEKYSSSEPAKILSFQAKTRRSKGEGTGP
jgi:transcriptional regulator with XRE-family HTH domain